MMEEDELEKIKKRYKHEIASIQRTIERFVSLRSWFVTTSLASLAFVLTFLLQIRLQQPLPNLLLAEIAIGFLMFSTVCALYTRFCYDASSTVGEVLDFSILFPVFTELIRNDANTSEKEKSNAIELLENQIEKINNLKMTDEKFDPYVEIWRFSITALALIIGLCASCIYFWLYLF